MAGALARLRFASPPKSALVVFDVMGSDVLERTALEGMTFQLLHCRGEVFYLSLPMLVRTVLRLRSVDWRLILRRRGGLLSQLYKAHLLACLDAMAPRVVVTWVDNSWLFHAVSRACAGTDFFAVQNGLRSIGCVTSNPPLRVPGGYVTSMPDLLCFGAFEEELYRSHGHRIDRFHPVGPLLGGYYLSRRGPAPAAPPRFDVCLVSQWRAVDFMSTGGHPVVKETVTLLARYLGRYAKERGVRVCMAARSVDPAETAFYRLESGPDVTSIPQEDSSLSLTTYQAMDDSVVVLSFCSTAVLEAFGWGKRALFCNLFKHKDFYMPPRPGPWMVDEPRYELFAEKLDQTLAMSPAEYEAAAGDFRRYAVAYAPGKPAHVYLRELIESRLALT